ncbi:MAG: tetratricopeptide repeat protein [Candidatus Acidiferrales bacterium]
MKKLSVAFAAALFCFTTLTPIHYAWAAQDSKSSSAAPTSAKQKAEDDIKVGDLANQNGNTDEAIADYKAALEADPSNRDAHQKFLQAYGQKAYAPLTPKKIKTAKKKPTKAQQEAKQEKIQAEQKKLELKFSDTLLATYRNWIKKNPQRPMFYWGEAQVLEDRDKNAEAKSLLQKAIAIDPSCAPAYEDLSDLAATDGDVAAQRQYAEKALPFDPKGSSGVFFNYALTYLSTDPAKYRQVVLDRVAKYPDGLEYLLVLVAQNAPSPSEAEAAYQKLYELYGPKSVHPSDGISDMMVSLFNLYAETDPSKALSFAQQMQKDQTEQLAKKAAADKAKDSAAKKSDAKPLWQSIADFQKSLIDARDLTAQKKYADAQALLAKNALKPKNDFDSLSGVDQTSYELAQAEALAGSGDTQKAYDSVKTALLPQPDDSLHAALVAYGAKLGKTPEQVNQDVWQARESKAKPMTPFALKQYVTDNEVKLADYRGQVLLVNFWFPG